MTQVHSRIDAISEIKRMGKNNGLQLVKDYLYFADSTMLRIWYRSDKARKELSRTLLESGVLTKHGKFVDADIAEYHGIPYGDERYGGELWLANNGVLVSPDMFNSGKIIKGMHGYAPEHSDSHGTCIAYGLGIEPNLIKDAELTVIHSLLKKYLHL